MLLTASGKKKVCAYEKVCAYKKGELNKPSLRYATYVHLYCRNYIYIELRPIMQTYGECVGGNTHTFLYQSCSSCAKSISAVHACHMIAISAVLNIERIERRLPAQRPR